jgi:hypothetical protein
VEVDEYFKKWKEKEVCKIADRYGDRFAMIGGVSEWRYKTGIDGEPAVSLQVSLVDCRQGGRVVWSATASSNDTWRASVGTTAQAIIERMFE